MIAFTFRPAMKKTPQRMDNTGRELLLPRPCTVCGRDTYRMDTIYLLPLHRLPCSTVYAKAQEQLREETDVKQLGEQVPTNASTAKY